MPTIQAILQYAHIEKRPARIVRPWTCPIYGHAVRQSLDGMAMRRPAFTLVLIMRFQSGSRLSDSMIGCGGSLGEHATSGNVPEWVCV
jgi:hypothetical protein